MTSRQPQPWTAGGWLPLGVEAIARKFVRRDVVPEVARFCDPRSADLGKVVELLLRSDDVLASMQECRKFGSATTECTKRRS